MHIFLLIFLVYKLKLPHNSNTQLENLERGRTREVKIIIMGWAGDLDLPPVRIRVRYSVRENTKRCVGHIERR